MPASNSPSSATDRIAVHNSAHLAQLVEATIAKEGPTCNLNHMDVSRVERMFCLFADTDFQGDISQWDVSNVTHMGKMFDSCPFNGDISRWNTKSLHDATGMFQRSAFNGDISQWNTGNLTVVSRMFAHCAFDGDLSQWDLNSALEWGFADGLFEGTPYSGDLSHWIAPHCHNLRGAFSPTFKGSLPRLKDPNKHGYAALFGSSKKLNRYLRLQPFNAVHFDVLSTTKEPIQNIDRAVQRWCQGMANAGKGVGMDPESLRAWAVQEYHRLQHAKEHGTTLELEPDALGNLLDCGTSM